MGTIETHSSTDRKATQCPVCGTGTLQGKFSHVVLGQHNADYCECAECGSLIVPEVDWLADAYASERVDPDTGAAQRSIICSLFIRAMRCVGLAPKGGRVLDFGAGNGLLVRLLRDQGFDAWGVDKHASMAVARNWRLESMDREEAGQASMITAIEVFEHLADPHAVLQSMVSALVAEGMVLLRTTLYDGSRHDENWYYLELSGGQHITLFSRKGVRKLAERCGLRATFLPFGFHLLRPASCTPIGSLRRGCLFLLSGLFFSFARVIGLCDCSRSSIDKTLVTGA
ncbi:MAG: class I SAM-dependent methyltransferase [Kiritimatiellia bacterium]|nr:class I SAM-dependent methyltransferase [Kiritimatiellia bacterium]MDP7023108.1 class I SAM-dependent methyltransferase [Kiritimatiellia bacterium]